MTAALRPVHILLVEDSAADRLIAQEAFAQSRITSNLHMVENGIHAMEFLRREGKYAEAPRPDLILLDLNLPKMDGRDVLAEIKADPRLRTIPVVILTTSVAHEDILKSYNRQANCFIAKPVDFDQFVDVVRSIENFWFKIVTLPPPELGAAKTSYKDTLLSNPDRGSIQILLLEDSPSDAFQIELALTNEPGSNFQVTKVQRLQDAIDLVRAHQFDLILTDLGLPDSDGLGTFESLHAAKPSIPVVVLTSVNDSSTGLAAVQAGAQDYLVKDQINSPLFAQSVRYAIERNQLQTQLRESQRMQAVGQLAGGIAHDFNNLLTVFFAQAELLTLCTNQDPEILEAAKEIARAAQRAASLTRQLLAFSRRQAMEPKILDLNDAVSDMHRSLVRLLGETIQIELQLSNSIAPVFGDIGMIEQVIMNLALNARDAMPSGGKLIITTAVVQIDGPTARRHPDASAGEFATLAIADSGCGISPANMAQLFQPFFTTKDVGKGTGLGLATVYGIVREHGGWISVESEVSRGSRFEVFLPVAAKNQFETSQSKSDLRSPAKRPIGRTVLLVEEEPQLRGMTKTVLARHGFDVLTASNGAEALALWSENCQRIEVILTDLAMEGITGLELARLVRELRQDMPVIFTGDYPQGASAGGESLIPGKNFLAKPYRPSELVEAIRRLLGTN